MPLPISNGESGSSVRTKINTGFTELATAQSDITSKAPLDSPAFTGTPTGITKSHVGLGNVDNTSDANKPVSSAQQTALNLKANLAGPALTGNPTAPTQATGDNSTRIATTAFVKAQNYLTTAPVTSVASKTGAVTLVKGDVGLGNVDNTADSAKPVSSAQQTALDGKQATLVSGTNIKTVNGASVLGSGNLAVAGTWAPKGITIPDPVNGDKIVLVFVPTAVTLTQVMSVLPGGSATPSVSFNIHYGTNVSLTGTAVFSSAVTVTNTTTGLSSTSFANATIPANSFVWLTVSAQSGTVPYLNLTLIGS